MRCAPVLVALVCLALTAPADASPRCLPQPSAEPLGALVRDSRTIHVLKVKALDATGVTFETAATLKGKAAEVPFGLLELHGEKEDARSLFMVGATVLCFVHGDAANQEGSAVALLHVGTCWVLGISPIAWRGEKHWFSFGSGGDFIAIYEGTDEALREHVAAILAGRETTITTRAPQAWNARGSNRLWRIKASLNITKFVMSDESPHFVGWGTGEADEVPKLMDALSAAAARERIRAADDLAHLGEAARPALPELRRALNDPEYSVALAAACAVAHLDAEDTVAVETLRARLRHAESAQRTAAARALADLGARARLALPQLLIMLADHEDSTRAAVAEALGQIAPGSPLAMDAVGALAALLKGEPEEYVRSAAVQSLLRFGPQAQEAIPALRESLSIPSEQRGWQHATAEAIALLARFNPVPVELLAEVLGDRHANAEARFAAVKQLASLGPRARAALPTLLQLLNEPRQPSPDGPDVDRLRSEVAEALLDIDPEGAPAVVAPVFLERVRMLSLKGARQDNDLNVSISVLGRCGTAAKPSLPLLLEAIDPNDTYYAPAAVSNLIPLLTSMDRELLPELRRRLGHWHDLDLAKALLRLGYRDEALAEVTTGLESDNPYRRTEAIRWLRQCLLEANSVAPALRQAQAKASDGTERARLDLTLWRLRAGGEDSPRKRALAGLDKLLTACEGESPLVGYLGESPFWSGRGPCDDGQREALGAAIDEVYCRVQAGNDPVAVLTRLLRDKDVSLRLAAVAALARAEPDHPDLIPTLRRLLDRHPNFLCYTADTLAALGPRAAPLAPLLLPNLRHPDESVYRVTDRVLRHIDPGLAARGWGAAEVPGAVPADLSPLWKAMADKEARLADEAAWRLAGAGPGAVALLRERLRPPPTLAPERVARLIVDLDDNDFATRERASTELAAGIESATLEVRRALAAARSLESRRRLEELLTGLDPANAAEQRRRLRGIRLLEEMSSPEARALLKSLSRGDPRFRLTREAAAALRRSDPALASPNKGVGRTPRRIEPKRTSGRRSPRE